MAFIQLNRENFSHNINQIVLQTGSVEKIAIVLKDNAYGHGLLEMGQIASEFGLKEAVVRTIAEAKRVASFFEHILILGDRAVVDAQYSFALNTLADIEKAEKGSRVELKVDTGMHRNGIAVEELSTALEEIAKRGLELVGVMTHYRSADVLSSEFFWQQKCFDSVKQTVLDAGYTNVRFHSHNSASILRTKSFDEDLVRVGIAAYGYNELPKPMDRLPLKPVLSLYAKKIATRKLKAGQRLGYGADFTADEEMTVSTYDLGYGDGWMRGQSSHPYVNAEGLAVLGRVSMDSMSFASDKKVLCIMNDAQKVAEHFSIISYEVTTLLHGEIEKCVI